MLDIFFVLKIRKDFSSLEKSEIHQLNTVGMSRSNRNSYNDTWFPSETLFTAKSIWKTVPANKGFQPCASEILKCIRQPNQTFLLPALSPCSEDNLSKKWRTRRLREWPCPLK